MSEALHRLVVRGPRVLIRPLSEADRAAAEPWAAAALRDVWGRGGREGPCGLAGAEAALSNGEASALYALEAPAGDLAGFVACDLGEGDDPWCTITLLTLRPDRRVTGYGGEAVLWLERALREAGLASRFRVGIPDGNGLAVYFWLRIGYRPLLRTKQGAEFRADRTWMVRTEP